MEILNGWFNGLCQMLYDVILEPLFYGMGVTLDVLISPASSFSPLSQITIVAIFGAFISRVITKRFSSQREKKLRNVFEEKLASLQHIHSVEDAQLRKIVKKGVNEAADEVYEKIVLDKFWQMGISYFLPLFFFLIWLEYHRFPSEKLLSLTGSVYVWGTESGLELSAATAYVYVFNIVLLVLWLGERGIRLILKHFNVAEPHA